MAKGSWTNNYFAVYRGDVLLAHGTLEEMSWLFNMRHKSLRELAHKSRYDRVAKAKNPNEWLVAVKVENLTTDDITITHRKRRIN